MIDSRNINDLKPYVKYLCELLIEKCKAEGITLLVTSTLRDAEYQKALYAQGRTKPGSIVTSTSLIGAHGFGLAFDVVPLVNGKADWSSNKWNRIGAIGKQIGLEWAGDWESFIEKCHFQYTKGLTNAQLRAGKMPILPSVPSKPSPIPTLDKQFRVYGTKLMGNGLTEQYAKDKAAQLKAQGYEVYYITNKGVKVEVK
jgi:peptidoglycan L-alanyl-D-glutamate endopeptidase CwlK